MSDPNRFLRIPEWYPVLAAHTFLTTFVRLRSEAQLLLAGKLADDRAVEEISERIIADLRQPLSSISAAMPGRRVCCSSSRPRVTNTRFSPCSSITSATVPRHTMSAYSSSTSS